MTNQINPNVRVPSIDELLSRPMSPGPQTDLGVTVGEALDSYDRYVEVHGTPSVPPSGGSTALMRSASRFASRPPLGELRIIEGSTGFLPEGAPLEERPVILPHTSDEPMATGGDGDTSHREGRLVIDGHTYSICNWAREGYVLYQPDGRPSFWMRSEDRGEILAAFNRTDGSAAIAVTYETISNATGTSEVAAHRDELGEPIMYDWSGRPVYESPTGDIYEDGTPYIAAEDHR